MKKLEFEKGAITPFWTKDLEYMQKGFEEVIKGICEGFKQRGRDAMIISGCNIIQTDTTIRMRPGWFYYFGEILPVKELEETECSVPNQRIYLIRRTGYDPSGKRTVMLEDSSLSKDIYREDYLEPSLEKKDGASYAITKDAWDLSERILRRSRMIDTKIVFAEINDNDRLSNVSVKYRQIGGAVQLYGGFIITGSNAYSGTIATGLPAPAEDVVFVRGECLVKINTSGNLSVQGAKNSLNIGDIQYLTDPVYDSNISNDGHYFG